MADYAQVVPNIVYSRFSDYSQNDFRPVTGKSYTTPTKSLEVVATAAASPTAIDLENFTSIDCLAITNEGASGHVYSNSFGILGTAALTVTFFTGNLLKDDALTGVIVSTGGYAGGTVRITNSASNDGDYIIDAVTIDTVESQTAGWANDVSDPLTLTFLSHCNTPIGPGETVILYDRDPTQPLLLTGANSVRVRAFGT